MKEYIKGLAEEFAASHDLKLHISYSMPEGYEDAYGTFDVVQNTLFLNLDILHGQPKYEILFYLFHELRHAEQYLHPERFDRTIQNSISYVILYNGVCFKLADGEWKQCRLTGDEDYFSLAYQNLPYEIDANKFACEKAKTLCPEDVDEIEALCDLWIPKKGFLQEEFEKLFRRIDESI